MTNTDAAARIVLAMVLAAIAVAAMGPLLGLLLASPIGVAMATLGTSRNRH